MSSEQELSNAIDAYLGKSAMPLPKGHPMRRGDADSWGEIKRGLRQAGEAIGVVKPKSEESSDVQKAKPKVLKPGSPEHTKAMAEMEATKAAKPKSTNPVGEESPSAAGSRDRLGDRPLVAFDKADGLNKYEEVPTEKIGGKMGGGSKQTSRIPELPNPVSRDMKPRPAEDIDKQAAPGQPWPKDRRMQTQAEDYTTPEVGWDSSKQGHNPTKQNFRRCIGEDCNTGFKYGTGPDRKPLECPHCGKVQDRHLDKQEAMGPFTKSVDLEDASHSWDYQG